ncbi:MAG: M10 family metallopeptidase [Paracoccus sp. (in: a-proteobacteria)]|uniref:M10 family metallopeptidase n=1 Tax=Paracoccus sp. TaxID=267 RepID=UPI0026DFEB11|nr:M10 family metallopeptidase [Paracoccus sp. (in: a-proteobacteria)]MDO5631781.1 M10 family metallopeptidase [Paracoccus sp. (in: a-proteobacteria)]
MKTLTAQQLATYLTSTYWAETGQISRKWYLDASKTLKVDNWISFSDQLSTIKLALQAWTDVSGIKFQFEDFGRTDIQLTSWSGGAYTESTMTATGRLTQATINVDYWWSLDYGTRLNSYYMQTWVHEIGHALGLGHAGLYNGTARYGRDNWFANDSWQLSVMSYFAPDDNPTVNASYAYAVTPMPADIIAIHQIYGKPTGVATGNTTYGWGSNATGIHKAVGNWIRAGDYGTPIMFTIYDQGGRDTINLSGDTRDQVVRLGQNQFSDILGHKGIMGIAYDTVIENYVAGSGNDHITANGAANLIRGGAGNDTILGLAGNDTIRGGAGWDRIEGGAGNDLLYGEGGRDTLFGGNGNDTLHGGDHADHLYGGNGNDVLWGGNNDDWLDGGGGDDLLNGGAGNDTLLGGVGNDTLNGGPGHDTLRGGAGDDRLSGGNGNDSLYGDDGNDWLHGHAGDDQLFGGLGNDTLTGGDGNDTLMGSSGHDSLSGGNGNDVLNGGAGNDTLNGGAGADTLTGGAGADIFLFRARTDASSDAPDVITDFNPAQDRLDLSALRLTLIGEDPFSGGLRQLRVVREDADLRLTADFNGDSRADFAILLRNLTTLPDDALIL